MTLQEGTEQCCLLPQLLLVATVCIVRIRSRAFEVARAAKSPRQHSKLRLTGLKGDEVTGGGGFVRKRGGGFGQPPPPVTFLGNCCTNPALAIGAQILRLQLSQSISEGRGQ